jgi:hypothetical protein
MGAEHHDSVSLRLGLSGPCLTVRVFVAVYLRIGGPP